MIAFRCFWACVLLTLFAVIAAAELRLDSYASLVHEFTLPNGLKVVVVEDHGAPVVTASFTVRGGYADDPKGMRGMAHIAGLLLEEGPETLGSRAIAEERAAIKTMNAAFAALRALQNKPGASGEYDRLQAQTKANLASRQAEALAKPRFSTRALEQYGAEDFRTEVSADFIQWSVRLPSNRADAFLLLYGEWLRKPFPRFVYSMRERLLREVNERVSSQDHALRRSLLRRVYGDEGYGLWPVESNDLAAIHHPDVEAYLNARFAASNLTLVLAGDITLAEAQSLAARYLEKIPAGSPYTATPPAFTQSAEVRSATPSELSPFMGVGYRRPPDSSPDDPVFDVIVRWLIEGPASRINIDFVKENPLFSNPVALASMPGVRQGGLMLLLAPHHPSRNPAEWIRLICEFLEEAGKTPPSAEAIAGVRRQLEQQLLSVLAEPPRAGMYIGRMGGWKPVAALSAAWSNVTPADVQRVAAEYIRPERRVIMQPGYVEPPAAPGAAR